ncbi:MAG: hypothetical protein FWF29_12025 [Treponema sp.]|nr:hypothetical protein [Treponema sp.]
MTLGDLFSYMGISNSLGLGIIAGIAVVILIVVSMAKKSRQGRGNTDTRKVHIAPGINTETIAAITAALVKYRESR